MYIDGVQISHANGQFLGKGHNPSMPDDTVLRCAKMAVQIEMPFGFLDSDGPNEAVAMPPYVKLL